MKYKVALLKNVEIYILVDDVIGSYWVMLYILEEEGFLS